MGARLGLLHVAVGCMLGVSACAQHGAVPDAPAPATDALTSLQQPADTDRGTRREKASRQVKEEEKQRILGVLPNFGTTYHSDAVSLTARQKMGLAFRSAVDPATFAIAAIVAGFQEANDDYGGFGWGAAGYGKRFGASYVDAFDGTMIGGGILPSLLHQDPRYFRLGHGTKKHRLLYAMASAVICKHDNSGRWEPNYSNVGGNILAGAISNMYYPSQATGWGQTFASGLVVTAEGMGGAAFDEFWPDISRKLLHRDPTHGQDTEAGEKDAAASARQKDSEKQPMNAEPK